MKPPPQQSLFHATVASCYLIAFLSYHVQLPGLFLSCGLVPLTSQIPLKISGLFFLPPILIKPHNLAQLLAFLGVTLSSATITVPSSRPYLFPIVTLTYSYLLSISTSPSAPFMSFQWDSLLTESGFVCSLHAILSRVTSSTTPDHLPRLLLFKLMFMSSLVKIQSACPTWLHLTALEYHYATQPLPTPLSWYALNYTHPLLQRGSVAVTFVVEMVAPGLLLWPSLRGRRIGGKLQVLLMVVIAATGNYTFFNVLTAGLAVGCFAANGADWAELDVPKWVSTVEKWAIYLGLASICGQMFRIGAYGAERVKVGSDGFLDKVGIMFKLGPADADRIAEFVVPAVMMYVVGYCLLVGLKDVCVAARKGRYRQALCAGVTAGLVSVVMCGTGLPMYTLTDKLRAGQMGGEGPAVARAGVEIYKRAMQPVSHGYGLFRTMTGVGRWEGGSIQSWGWAGLPPSVVARPEIVVEGLFNDDEGADVWREIKFIHKPGPLDKKATWVAPYQPRMDWQMWFAALGSYQNNPWFISLLDSLMEGREGVVDLTGESLYSLGGMKAVKATLWDYDFTRVDNAWNRKIPGVEIGGDNWWSRKNPREYVPVLEKGNGSVKAFLEGSGITHDECGKEKLGLDRWCEAFRENGGVWSPVIVMFLGGAIVRMSQRGWLPKWVGKRRMAKYAAEKTVKRE